MIDWTFSNIIKLFVLLFKNGDSHPTKDSSVNYYMLLLEIKNFNALINNKPFLISRKNKQEAFEKLAEMSRNDDLYNRKRIRFFVPSKFLQTHWHRFI